jgi:hypothetical protein
LYDPIEQEILMHLSNFSVLAPVAIIAANSCSTAAVRYVSASLNRIPSIKAARYAVTCGMEERALVETCN